MKLSKRLSAVIELLDGIRLLADIGCDHGYVCIEAVRLKKAEYAVAADVVPGPLKISEANIQAAGLSDRIRVLLSDGFRSFPDDLIPDGVNITGMGGYLLVSILRAAAEKGIPFSGMHQLVLGPQSDLDIVRHYLIEELKLPIRRELCILDEGKYYFLMELKPQDASGTDSLDYSETDWLFGKYPDPGTLETYREYLAFTAFHTEKALQCAMKGASPDNQSKLLKLQEKLELIRKRQKELMENGI